VIEITGTASPIFRLSTPRIRGIGTDTQERAALQSRNNLGQCRSCEPGPPSRFGNGGPSNPDRCYRRGTAHYPAIWHLMP
jgi:hypothetical protein